MPRSFLFTSESVAEGHPDKVCDAISDAVLDAIIANDPRCRVACETLVKTGLVVIAGEVTTTEMPDVQAVARSTIRRIGYTKSEYKFDADSCGVLVALEKQSPDIARGVTQVKPELQGAGDQGMMFGYADNQTPQFMPLPINLAHRLTRRLSQARKDNILPWLRPDGKAQVTVLYKNGQPKAVTTVVISTQHSDTISSPDIRQAIIEHVINTVIPKELQSPDIAIHVNPSGRFVIGGPVGDCGVTGRKIIVDTYGGWSRHGGGCFSGKDPTKVDRSAAYAARQAAKSVVAAGLADKCEIQLAYAIGIAQPVSIHATTFGTGQISDQEIEQILAQVDFRPAAIISRLNLLQPIYRATATYGHFGQPKFPWEQTLELTSVASPSVTYEKSSPRA